jgi:stress response protein SCP2
MDHVDWLEQDDIDVLCAALKDQVKVRMDRKYVFYWNWESYSM